MKCYIFGLVRFLIGQTSNESMLEQKLEHSPHALPSVAVVILFAPSAPFYALEIHGAVLYYKNT
jgi:hypothetical protein